MPGDAEATKQRLLEAATSEFAACGLAGAVRGFKMAVR
jgi:hypothetical protein